ncbi:MAG: type 1 periplasmic-binding domain-containing protein [Candidatus Dormibacteria bacterium]
MGALALALMIAILPSSLHLPITGPGGQAEVAPVPGQGKTQANLSQLGLADSGTVGAGGSSALADAGMPTPPLTELLQGLQVGGTVAQQFHCVGNPPRQIEDPLSPPCAAPFKGDNGGATYQGVTPNSITIVLADQQYGTQGADYTQAPQPADDPYDITARALLRFFEARFQTYGRSVRLVKAGCTCGSPGGSEMPYQQLQQMYHPFAFIDEHAMGDIDRSAPQNGQDVFAVSDRGNGDFCGQASSALTTPYTWCFSSSTNRDDAAFGGYVCSGLVGRHATQAGGALSLSTRKFGILEQQGQSATGDDIAAALKQTCGLNPAVYTWNPPTDYTTAIARMNADGITSVIVANPMNAVIDAAPQQDYFPEWIWPPFGTFNSQSTIRNPSWNPQEMAGSFGLVDNWRWRPVPQPYWYAAAQAASPGLSPDTTAGSSTYYGLLMAFTAIQMAGPHLTPTAVQSALERFTAADDPPWSPHAGYAPGDHSFIHDFTIARWDNSAVAPGTSQPGCERLADGGRRYRAEGPWPTDDRVAGTGSEQPCGADEANNVDAGPDEGSG